jgi:hypothetical protein
MPDTSGIDLIRRTQISCVRAIFVHRHCAVRFAAVAPPANDLAIPVGENPYELTARSAGRGRTDPGVTPIEVHRATSCPLRG